MRRAAASNVLPEAERLTAPHANASAVLVDMGDAKKVQRLVEEADLVVRCVRCSVVARDGMLRRVWHSLLPVPFHPSVAEMCLKHKKHLVTASYISPAMRALHDRYVCP